MEPVNAAVRWMVAVVLGCGGASGRDGEPAGRIASTGAPATGATLAPVPSPASIGELSARSITGAPVSLNGLVATRDGLVMLVSDAGRRVDVKLGRASGAAGAPWRFTPVTEPSIVGDDVVGLPAVGGRIAARERDLAVTLKRFEALDRLDTNLEVRWPDPTVPGHVVCSDASVVRHGLVITAEGPAVISNCADDLRLASFRDGAWRDVVLADESAWVIDAAVDHLGAIHVLTTKGYLIVDNDQVRSGTLPDRHYESEGIAGCGGRIWAAFAIEGDAGSKLWVGTWTGARWDLERLPSEYIASVSFGFDESCRPFVASGNDVFARGAQGWVARAVRSDASIKALAVRAGVLHAAYEVVRNGVEVGIATAPVTTER